MEDAEAGQVDQGEKIAEVKELMTRKDAIESEIKELSDLLQSQQGVGMDGSLVDEEQYPRSDIDIYSVRRARHRIICLQNDHKALMKEIEKGLHEVHATAHRQQSLMEVDTIPQQMRSASFAIVDVVDEGSPAHSAGLQKSDELVEFGSVTALNFASLQNISTIVQHSIGKPLHVKVRRKGEEVRLTLTPNTWSGRGYLGCKIIPTGKVPAPER